MLRTSFMHVVVESTVLVSWSQFSLCVYFFVFSVTTSPLLFANTLQLPLWNWP